MNIFSAFFNSGGFGNAIPKCKGEPKDLSGDARYHNMAFSRKLNVCSPQEASKLDTPQATALQTAPQEIKPACPQQIPAIKRRSPRQVSELSSTTHAPAPASSGTPFTAAQVQERILLLLRPSSIIAKEVAQVSQLLGQELRQGHEGPCPVPELAVALSAAVSHMGCKVLVRRMTDTKQYWSKSMGSTFAICTLPGSHGQVGSGLVIEPNFREQFSTPFMTQRYRDIWSVLPEVFVGQASQLSPLLQLLCYELTLMFDGLGRQLPPWRTFPATQGRWLSSSCFDLAVPSKAGPGASEQIAKILANVDATGRASQAVGRGKGAAAAGQLTGGGSRAVVVTGFHLKP